MTTVKRRPMRWDQSTTQGSWRRSLRPLCAVLIALTMFAGSDGAVRAGDSDLARFLLKGGKKAVQKRDYEGGIARLEKALAEDESVIEAHYWIGYAHDKQHNNAAAVTAYRAFRHACRRCESEGDLARSLASLLRKTQSRLKILAAAETELSKLNERFVRSAVSLAKKTFLRDPALAIRAANAVLVVDPENEAARMLLEKLQQGSSEDAASASSGEGPTSDVKEWDDFIARSLFGKNQGWSYANGMLRIDRTTGKLVSPKREYDSPRAFVYEIEARILETYDDWCLGVCFGGRGRPSYTCHMARTEIVLWRLAGDSYENLVRHPIQPLEKDTWHRLAVAVKGNRVKVFLGGEKLFEHMVRDVKDFAGDVGIFHQDNRCEIRILRLGSRE